MDVQNLYYRCTTVSSLELTAHVGLLRAIRACVSISLIARTLKHEQENEKDAFLSE